MKSARVLSVLLSLSIFFSAAAVADKACATVLYAIEIERGATETKVHLKADGPIRDYREVRLKKDVAARRPDRMYLDLKQVRLAGPIPVKQVGTALAKVRNARRPEGLRVVFPNPGGPVSKTWSRGSLRLRAAAINTPRFCVIFSCP